MQQLITTGQEQETAAQLAHAEQTIERATRNAFYEVGLQLKHIRDQRLYRQDHDTFEDYCLQRWEWTAERVRQLITAAEVVQQIPTTVGILPAAERQVRPLLTLEKPEQRAEVWQRVVASGERITAKAVEAEVARKLDELKRDWYSVADWQALAEDDRRRIIGQPYAATPTFNETNDNIEWAAYSWNPVTGCLHNCSYCYARDIANRFYAQGFDPAFLPSRLHAPANTKPRAPRWEGDTGCRSVFVCSMADLFGKWVPEEWIQAVFEQVRDNPQWTFLFLTKFPQRLAEREWPENAWVGTTVDRQHRVEIAERAFRNVRAGVRWLSCEPLLEELTFSDLGIFDWIIVGGQSKSTQEPERQPEWSWVWRLLRQAEAAGLDVERQVYWKSNLSMRPRGYPTPKWAERQAE